MKGKKKYDFENFEQIQLIFPESDVINDVILLQRNRLAASFDDHNIHIYNTTDYELDIIIENEFEELVNAICEISKDILLASSYGDIKIFQIGDKEYNAIYSENDFQKSWIKRILKISDNLFASCSCDSTIKILQIINNET